MITSYSLQQKGYTAKQSTSIMRKLKSLNCEVKEIKICSEYVRNGTKCDYLRFSNGIGRLEALNALRRYNENIPCNADKEFWTLVLQNMEDDMTKILGKCKCGELITKWTNYESSPRTDKTAYKHTNDESSKWFIFRCRECSSVITESWSEIK